MKILCAALVLACASLAAGNSRPAHPSDKIAQFVVQNLDANTLPQELRPKLEKGKKTLEQYGFVPVTIGETEAVLGESKALSKIVIRILEQRGSEIYVCAQRRQASAPQGEFQCVLLLKRKDSNGLLKSKESWREFASCPSIGGAPDWQTSSY